MTQAQRMGVWTWVGLHTLFRSFFFSFSLPNYHKTCISLYDYLYFPILCYIHTVSSVLSFSLSLTIIRRVNLSMTTTYPLLAIVRYRHVVTLPNCILHHLRCFCIFSFSLSIVRSFYLSFTISYAIDRPSVLSTFAVSINFLSVSISSYH